MFKRIVLMTLLFASAVASFGANTQELAIVENYSQDELLGLIAGNQHLQRVKADRCQLNRDIRANAEVLKQPAYQFLLGDMLTWGVCLEKNPRLGMEYIKRAAEQGLTEANEQLGRYYFNGIVVPENKQKGLRYLLTAAYAGNLSATLQLADAYLDGEGNADDFAELYRLLALIVSEDKNVLAIAKQRKASIAEMIPTSVRTLIDLQVDQ